MRENIGYRKWSAIARANRCDPRRAQFQAVDMINVVRNLLVLQSVPVSQPKDLELTAIAIR